MRISIIQSSLNPSSKTAIVLEEAMKLLQEKNISVDMIDLREYDIPHCDGSKLEEYTSTDLSGIYSRLEAATHYIIGMPVYQYTFSGVLKNFLDIFGGAMKGKAFGVVENSGSVRAYLSPAALIDSLFFEFNAIPVPPAVHSRADDFEEGKLKNEHVTEKIEELIGNLQRVS